MTTPALKNDATMFQTSLNLLNQSWGGPGGSGMGGREEVVRGARKRKPFTPGLHSLHPGLVPGKRMMMVMMAVLLMLTTVLMVMVLMIWMTRMMMMFMLMVMAIWPKLDPVLVTQNIFLKIFFVSKKTPFDEKI